MKSILALFFAIASAINLPDFANNFNPCKKGNDGKTFCSPCLKTQWVMCSFGKPVIFSSPPGTVCKRIANGIVFDYPKSPLDLNQLQLITFSEMPDTPANGAKYKGVTFGYSGSEAFLNRLGPGDAEYINGAGLEGHSDGTLSLNFARPVNKIYFGIARSVVAESSAIVKLYNHLGAVIKEETIVLRPINTFAEGFFDYCGAKAVRKVEVTFPSDISRFIIDNLVTNALVKDELVKRNNPIQPEVQAAFPSSTEGAVGKYWEDQM